MTMIRMKKEADANFINERTKAIFANYLPIEDYYGEMGIKGIDISGVNLSNLSCCPKLLLYRCSQDIFV